jgi:hypothetical protein
MAFFEGGNTVAMHHYIVCKDGAHWKTSFHGTDEGPFPTKEDATASAIAGAKAAGLDVEVLVQDVDLKFHSAWKSTGQPPASDGTTYSGA